jgi:hypothetical protein
VPILVRPVREQIEHDRVIRQLQSKWRKKFKVDANPGDERSGSIKVGAAELFPDLILTSEGGKKPAAVIEIETSESVNHLEAMSQWANFAKSKIPFYLFVPGSSLDAARRHSADFQIQLTELWTYLILGDQVRFTQISKVSSSYESVTDKFFTDKAEKFERPEPVERVQLAPQSDETAADEVAESRAAPAVTPSPAAAKAEKPAGKGASAPKAGTVPKAPAGAPGAKAPAAAAPAAAALTAAAKAEPVPAPSKGSASKSAAKVGSGSKDTGTATKAGIPAKAPAPAAAA